IPIEEPEFQEDIKLINSIYNINLIQSIYDIFKHSQLTTSIEDFIYTVGPYLCNLFNAQRFSVALIDWESESVTAEVAYISKPDVIPCLNPGFTQKLNETSLSLMLNENQQTRIINNLEEHYVKTKSISTHLILEEGFRSNLTALASINNRPFGFFFLSSEKEYNFNDRDARLFASISNILSHRLHYSLTTQKLLSYFGNSLVNIVEFRDNETGNHVKRVAWYGRIIAEELKLPPKIVREIYEYSPLHDIGKVSIPDAILLKPGKLDEKEWEIMKKHVENGVKIIEEFEKESKWILEESSLKTMKNIILEHHEWWEGSGYPEGKRGEQISIEGRIIAIADVFDALTTKRPYKEAYSFEEAVEQIIKERGTHFDPMVVDAFLKRIDDIRTVYEKLKD
ncbi:MAG: HD domain-containing phosphohydrolase, partial [Fervidobacterium sp.]